MKTILIAWMAMATLAGRVAAQVYEPYDGRYLARYWHVDEDTGERTLFFELREQLCGQTNYFTEGTQWSGRNPHLTNELDEVQILRIYGRGSNYFSLAEYYREDIHITEDGVATTNITHSSGSGNGSYEFTGGLNQGVFSRALLMGTIDMLEATYSSALIRNTNPTPVIARLIHIQSQVASTGGFITGVVLLPPNGSAVLKIRSPLNGYWRFIPNDTHPNNQLPEKDVLTLRVQGSENIVQAVVRAGLPVRFERSFDLASWAVLLRVTSDSPNIGYVDQMLGAKAFYRVMIDF